jgi:hypothetical protein
MATANFRLYMEFFLNAGTDRRNFS